MSRQSNKFLRRLLIYASPLPQSVYFRWEVHIALPWVSQLIFCVSAYMAVLWVSELILWASELILWASELILWVSELMLWVSELILLVSELIASCFVHRGVESRNLQERPGQRNF